MSIATELDAVEAHKRALIERITTRLRKPVIDTAISDALAPLSAREMFAAASQKRKAFEEENPDQTFSNRIVYDENWKQVWL